ncbi:MAG: peptidase MA family metallohydrolase [Gemmatimonadaceae bacterium]
MRRSVWIALLVAPVLAAQEPVQARPVEIDSGRFSFVAFPRDAALARSLLVEALSRDTFPGLPRPRAHARILITPDALHFHDAVGPSAPEWGAAIATPADGRIVMQGSRANAAAGDPRATLRHELAHLALHEALGDLAPRWFDEGYASYAAGETGRDDVLATNIALVFRGVPPLDSLDGFFERGESDAQAGYALARSAVAAIAALDPVHGLSLFFRYWHDTRSMDQGMRGAYGLTEAAFEVRWRAGTRRRYGALALFADVSFAAGILLAVVWPFWLIRRRRDRERMAAMRAADEREERREREAVLHALLYAEAEPGRPPPESGTKPGNENLIN